METLHIKEILAKSQPGLSPTSNKRICVCGHEYTHKEWNRPDGSILKDAELCSDCKIKKRQADQMVELETDLKRVIREEMDWKEDSHIPPYFNLKTFGDYDGKLQPKAFNAVKNLQWKFEDGSPPSSPKSLVLLSPGVYGVGKTHLVCALINQIVETEEQAYITGFRIVKRQCPVYFISENELLRRIRNTYNRSNAHNDDEHYEETEENVYNKLARLDLLIIDDVGKVRAKDPSFLQGVYFNIIDQRYNGSAPIILTTNLDFAELENHIGGACADRLREMCGKNFVKMAGKSYRRINELPQKT